MPPSPIAARALDPAVPAAASTLPAAADLAGIVPGAVSALVAVSAARLALLAAKTDASILAANGSAGAEMAISGEQIEQLPLPGRHWENFVLDTPAGESNGLAEAERTSNEAQGPGSSVTVDGVSTRLAFGGQAGGRSNPTSLDGALASETSIQEFQLADRENGGADTVTGERIHMTTRSGTQKLHGQASYFDRQNVLGARNPFTQWVKESSPGTQTSTPVFTPTPLQPWRQGEPLGRRDRRTGSLAQDLLVCLNRWERPKSPGDCNRQTS